MTCFKCGYSVYKAEDINFIVNRIKYAICTVCQNNIAKFALDWIKKRAVRNYRFS